MLVTLPVRQLKTCRVLDPETCQSFRTFGNLGFINRMFVRAGVWLTLFLKRVIFGQFGSQLMEGILTYPGWNIP